VNILYINHYAGSPHHGMEFRPYYLAREWTQLGHTVWIVAASYSHLRQVNVVSDQLYLHERIDGIRYTWCKTPTYQGNGIKRVYNIFVFLYRLKQLHKLFGFWKPDWVIASSTYPLDIFPAQSIAKSCCAKLIYEVHDLWPLSLIEVGGFSYFHPFIRLLQYAENSAYRHAEKVISMLPNAKPHMLEHGMAEEKYHVIPNGINLAEWIKSKTRSILEDNHDIDFNELRKKYRFLLGYLGGHGSANALDDLLEAMTYLRHGSIGVILVGEGSQKNLLIAKAQLLGLNNIYFYPAVPKKEVPALLKRFDALYLGWKKLPIYRFGINPNKLFDYMMSGKPILHACAFEHDPVKIADCGLSVDAENPQAIASGIEQILYLDQNTKKCMGFRGQNYVLKHHDYKKLAKLFLTDCQH